MDKYTVHLCEGCIALMDEHYPYTVPREHLEIITVPTTECDNADLENYNKKLSERNAVPDDEEVELCNWCKEPNEELIDTDLGKLCDTCIRTIRSRGGEIKEER